MAVPSLDERAVAVAQAEWWHFGSPYVDGENSSLPLRTAAGAHLVAASETKDGWRERTWTYMKMGVYPKSDDWMAHKASPWSAAFISYVMRMAGAGSRFPYSMSHSTYAEKAVRNRMANLSLDTLIAYRSDELQPQIGDLMWRGRKSEDPNEVDTTGWTLDNIIDYLKKGHSGFPSHCDLVVSTDLETKRIYLVGGNVRNRVLRTQLDTDSGGLPVGAAHTVIIKNTISG